MSIGTGIADARPVLALSGGVGGAKLVLGLSRVVPAGALHVLANIGDDFEHLGLAISPDIDTLLYTLADLADPDRGWGRRDETWSFMSALAALGGATWFRLGDADLALHVERTRALAAGDSLAAFTDRVRRSLGIGVHVWPASDDRIRTRLHTRESWLSFQDYFVARRCEPVIDAIDYEGARAAHAYAPALELLRSPTLRAVIVCPSNPLLSIAPMLAMAPLRDALRTCAAPIIAVSPIVGGDAVKGPTAKLLHEMGEPVDALAAARTYQDFLDGYLVDVADSSLAGLPPAPIHVAAEPILMTSIDTKIQLAHACLRLADALASRKASREALQ
jgi:LPPG:FO 2-phospho-L-lactate transferase